MHRTLKLILCLLIAVSLFACHSSNNADNDSSAPSEGGDGSKTMVVYFSATGNTDKIAQLIAEVTGGKLARILPAKEYSREDLNYSDKSSRATSEQNDPKARPEIANDISLTGCETLYLGYPIWWGQAPRIMSSFVESHDLTGITVIPFCTSGSSDIADSDDNLADVAGRGNWKPGKRFSGSAGKSEIEKWIGDNNNMNKSLHLSINDREVPVTWEANRSVAALKQLASDKEITVKMSRYGGFEQVGPLGSRLVSDDVQTSTSYGDIVLYSGNQIVIFFGSNSWSYTRLGHVDLSEGEMRELLDHDSVTAVISAK
ncbi:MAG: hypothetical protein II704_00535 [Erysipelotrichaceae bacterium]|nr:hypothetical protein [Erysipelotrichaceae bacterium]